MQRQQAQLSREDEKAAKEKAKRSSSAPQKKSSGAGEDDTKNHSNRNSAREPKNKKEQDPVPQPDRKTQSAVSKRTSAKNKERTRRPPTGGSQVDKDKEDEVWCSCITDDGFTALQTSGCMTL